MPQHLNGQEYDNLRDLIANANNTIRCVQCGKLLAKSYNGMISIKRKDTDLVVLATELKIRCPVCEVVNVI